MGIRYSAVPGHTTELADALNEVLSAKWSQLRGVSIVSFGVSSITANEEDENTIKELQKTAVFRNPNFAVATLVSAQADAMRSAAANEGGMGAMMGFMGMNMAQGAGGMNEQNLFQMGQQQQYQQQAAAPSAPAAPAAQGWTCACGTSGNTGKFCNECGAKKPAGIPQYQCDKCGWEPEDKAHPPKFCPECGDPFDDGDIR